MIDRNDKIQSAALALDESLIDPTADKSNKIVLIFRHDIDLSLSKDIAFSDWVFKSSAYLSQTLERVSIVRFTK